MTAMQLAEQEGNSRRTFLKSFIGAFSTLVALALGIPLIGTFIGSSFRSRRPQWVKVGNIASLTVGQPANLKFPFKTEDAYLRETILHNVWVIKHSSIEVTVYSPICPHLGCHYDWHSGQNEFICPCHGSVYAMTGKVLGGPAPRPLDVLPWKVEGNVLFVEWETFKVGIPEKIQTS